MFGRDASVTALAMPKDVARNVDGFCCEVIDDDFAATAAGSRSRAASR
jgi:hypothetical protein